MILLHANNPLRCSKALWRGPWPGIIWACLGSLFITLCHCHGVIDRDTIVQQIQQHAVNTGALPETDAEEEWELTLNRFVNLDKTFPGLTEMPALLSVQVDPAQKQFLSIWRVAEKEVRLSGTITHKINVPVLNKMMPKGSTVQTTDIIWKRVREHDVRAGGIRESENLEGKVARRQLQPGKVINDGQVHKPLLIHRNKIVPILFKTPNITLKTFGKALSSGALGDEIQVMNNTSKRILVGQVTARGSVLIRGGADD